VIYFLDTNVVIALIKGVLVVRERLRRAIEERATVAISSLVFFELWYGAAKSERPRETTERLRLFLSADIAVVPFEEEDAATAGDLRASLGAKGTPIGPYDVLIAAHALRIGATLVTANVSELARVPGLTVEDWTK
jgi:tRNA(fMet)-specific endonuclease VapC